MKIDTWKKFNESEDGVKSYTANDIDHYKDTGWSAKIDGEKITITISDVEEYLKDVDVVRIKVKDIASLSINKDKKDKKTLDRVQKSDLRYPIIITSKGGEYYKVLDGNHRLQKAINNEIDTIKAKVLKLEDAPNEYKKMFD